MSDEFDTLDMFDDAAPVREAPHRVDVSTINEGVARVAHFEMLEVENQLLDAQLHHENDGQLAFIDPDDWWKVEWQGMPEFRQDDIEPWKDLIVHFRTRDDMLEFARLLDQKLTSDTRAVWYPEQLRQIRNNLFYVDES